MSIPGSAPSLAIRSHPWAWLAAGFFAVLAACALYPSEAGLVPGSIAVTLGLFLVGVAAALRLQAAPSGDFERFSSLLGPARVVLTLFLVGVVGVFSWALIAAIVGIDPFRPSPHNLNVPMNIKIGPMLIAWLLVVPLTLRSLWTIWRNASVPGSIESGLLLAVVCGTVLLAGLSLPLAAVTLRFFLAVLAFVVAFGVSLITAPVRARYAVLSILAVFHFLAIITATLATAPAPWLATQVWHRLAHPYLEFMYLNNAYHFYSPDPGAATHFWMRVYYDTGKKIVVGGEERPDLDAVWVKIPEMDQDGQQHYPVALEYQRMLSLTENIVPSDPSPLLYTIDDKGLIDPGPTLKNRLINSPVGSHWRRPEVGQAEVKPVLEVPLMPGLAPEAQYQKPAAGSLRLMSSYVRYAARKPHPEHPEWPIYCVRAYRAIHTIPPWPYFLNGADPNDPTTYRPVYNGTFDKDGVLQNANEEFLYWMLPSIHGQAEHPDSPVFCWHLLHAGERNFIYLPETKKYVRLSAELRKKFPPEWTERLHVYAPLWAGDWE